MIEAQRSSWRIQSGKDMKPLVDAYGPSSHGGSRRRKKVVTLLSCQAAWRASAMWLAPVVVGVSASEGAVMPFSNRPVSEFAGQRLVLAGCAGPADVARLGARSAGLFPRAILDP